MTRIPDEKTTTAAEEPPRWINPLLAAAALLALAAVGAALAIGGNEAHEQGLIADITVNLGGRPVREHCTTCHVEGGRPHRSDGAWTSARHPDIAPHASERLGCTGCHLGEGMALDATLSHGLPGLGARQVLAGDEVQGRCFACHALGPLAGAERAWAGYRLYRRKACDLCHHLDGLAGGFGYGPDLSTVGSQLGLEKLREAIREPRLEPRNSIMPRFPFSPRQAGNLAYFLKSRVAEPLTTSPMWAAAGRPGLPAVEMVPEGVDRDSDRALLWRGDCLACHRFENEDGRIAPDLTAVGTMRRRDYIAGFLDHPTRLIPGAIMPPTGLAASEQKRLVDFLAEPGTAAPLPPTARQVYMHFCQRCHAGNGDGRGLIQPNLVQAPRAFAGNAEFFRRATDARLRDSLARGIAGTSMPPYENVLPEKERERLLDLVFQAFIGIDRRDKAELKPLPDAIEPPPRGRQDALFAEHCSRCHGRTGTGKGPEALDHLPRPRNLTNTPYFAALADTRILRAILDGIPGTAMPAWRSTLSDAAAWALVAKVRRLAEGKP